MTRVEQVMKIKQGDHTSRRVQINGYPVTLRFSSAASPEIDAQVKQILLSSIALDSGDGLWDDCADKNEKEESE